ncbi:hypothetical protein [Sulfitobacter sp. M23508]|uniref:hypothetical protein n=1 Tax=Sulfitobacter sp. M23508 TaxID=3368577 RepID=UPI0037475911
MKHLSQEELEKEWLSELERIGARNVRSRMSSGEVGSSDGASVNFVKIDGRGGLSPRPSRLFVENWLSEKETSGSKRTDMEHRLIWVAAIAAVLGVIMTMFK